ncbi:MAG: SAM-dependent methyltransferase [SAR202 cluster bacterium Io17-Chloro-G4]|nr:MAG: SAM-dependent methyltransferase [SAR202 cluster bacterium Io17-Chloro-G4]
MKQVYEAIGIGYARARRPDTRIARAISVALGDARTVVNMGAGTGNYEPVNRQMVAVEPASEMLYQRPASAHPAVRAVAEALPFSDRAFDAALATFALHHWSDCAVGLSEMRRVARKQVIVLFEPAMSHEFWLVDYFPEILSLPAEVGAPGVEEVGAHLRVRSVTPLPIPSDCTDGFAGAYWRRPKAYLDPSVRASISSLAQLSPKATARGVAHLEQDLKSGAWDARYGHLRSLTECDLGYRLVIAD